MTAADTGSARVRAVLVTHANLGAELIRTAESILGRQEGVAFVTNSGLSLESMAAAVEEKLGAGTGPMVLFVDLLGGSCCHVCSEIRRLYPDCAIYSGVNLPMLMEFLFNRDRFSFGELKKRILAKGRSGIQCL